MRVLFVTSEVSPFSKTGGLADVSGALPAALADRGADIRVATPLYRHVRQGGWALEPAGVCDVSGPGGVKVATVYSSGLSAGPQVWFIDQPRYFDRPGLYGERGEDYPDNLERFSFLCRAVLRWVRTCGWEPDVVHCNDWQTALVPVYMRVAETAQWDRAGTVLTVHNLAYQGLFPSDQFPVLDLPVDLFTPRHLEFWGRINLLKGGLVFADVLNTVSETYAREIQTEEFGCGLEGVLRERSADLYGILNGVDYSVWDPRNDPWIPARYGPQDLSGKAVCKAALQSEMGLRTEPQALLFGMVSRLVEQKGVDLVVACVERIVQARAQLAVLGTGDPQREETLLGAARAHPGSVAVRIGFDERLAHWIEAGSDAFLMPSRYEPSGLNQLYSLRYGTVPVVRRTGGLADSVVDATPEALARGEANGFVFDAYTPDALWGAIARALVAYRDGQTWERLVRAGMAADFSWHRAAGRYLELYRLALAKRRAVPS